MSASAEESPSHAQPSKITSRELALIVVLVAIHFTHMVDFVIIMPLGKRLMGELDITPVEFGWILSVYALAAGIASFLASMVMDRFDRKWVLLSMYGGFALSTLFCGLAQTYESLILARTLAGVFGGLAAVTIMAVIGDVFPAEKRGRATGAITSAFALALVLGLPGGLVLVDMYGRGAPFIALAGLGAVLWVVAAFWLPPVRGHLTHERRHVVEEFAAVAREPNHQRAFVFSFFLTLGTFIVGSFMAPYLSATNDWGETEMAEIYCAGGICTLLAMSVVGRLADRFQRLMLFRIFAGITIVCGLVMTNLPAIPVWVGALALSAFMAFSTARIVPAQAMLLGTPQPRVRGAFMSLNTAVQHLATGLAPVLAGSLITQTSDGKMTGFWVAGVLAALVSGVSLVLAGGLRPAPDIVVTPPPEPQPESEAEPVAAA